MGISTGLQAAHNDDLHVGNAKRAAASGLASLDASSKVVQEPASKAAASGLASLDASSKVVQEPASKAAASGLASLDAASKVVQEPASKGLASGIASLDAGSKVAVANLPVNVASGIAGLDASSRVPAAQLALAELLANKNAASGYAGLDASVLLALTQQRLNYKIGSFTRDTAAASGTQAITSIGFIPRMLIFIAQTANAGEICIGVASDAPLKYVVTNNHQVAANTWAYQNFACIMLIQGAGISYYCDINSYDADGFTLNWTKLGAKTGTATIVYIAIR